MIYVLDVYARKIVLPEFHLFMWIRVWSLSLGLETCVQLMLNLNPNRKESSTVRHSDPFPCTALQCPVDSGSDIASMKYGNSSRDMTSSIQFDSIPLAPQNLVCI